MNHSTATQLNVKLTILSPVHIGCNEYYDLTNSFFDSENTTYYLKEYNLFNYLVNQVTNHNQLENIFMPDNFRQIQKELNAFLERNKPNTILNKIELPYDLFNKWKNYIDQRTNEPISRFEIERTIFHLHSKKPYIPGSSLKGALRTAILDQLISEKYDENNLSQIIDNRQLQEEKVLNYFDHQKNKKNIEKDPFRYLKISDFQPISLENLTKIFLIKHTNRDSFSPKSLTQYLECIVPGKVFEGKITLYKNSEIHFNDLFRSIEKFFQARLDEEEEIYKKLNKRHGIRGFYTQLKNKHENKKLFLIRLGKHTAAESKTIEIIRKKNKTINGKPSPSTIWFATEKEKDENIEKIFPLGWAVLRIEN